MSRETKTLMKIFHVISYKVGVQRSLTDDLLFDMKLKIFTIISMPGSLGFGLEATISSGISKIHKLFGTDKTFLKESKSKL